MAVAENIVSDDTQTAPSPDPLREWRRLAIFLPGHDPTDMTYHHGRFAHQAKLFGELWSVDVDVTDRLDGGDKPYARWTIKTRAPNWATRTDYRILRWEDIVAALDARADPIRLWKGVGGLTSFLFGGAMRGYFRASVRYGMFFFYPYIILLAFILGGLLAGGLAGFAASYVAPPLVAWIVGLVVGVGAFFGLFHRPGRDWRLHQALDDWDLAREYLNDRTPELDERLDSFAQVIIDAVHSGKYDEIVLVGHSLGATLVLGVLDRALDRDPSLANGQTRLCLLTCGATIPKLALHRRGDKVRRQAARVARTPGLYWVEYQARHDVINFYKFHPVTLRRTQFEDNELCPPQLRNANLKDMLSDEKLHRLRWQLMRLHYQFLLANELHAPYDYFMFILGPLPLADITSRPDGPLGRFAADGALITETTDPS